MKEYIDFWIAKNITDLALCVIVCIVVGVIYVIPTVSYYIINKVNKFIKRVNKDKEVK